MPSFSERSLSRLDTCSPLLREIAKEAIKVVDFSVIWGHRTKVDQNKFFTEGFSETPWPRSKHNSWPSHAIDIVPWPVNWDDRERFFYLAGVFLTIAREKGVRVRWGGAWDGSFNQSGSFDDLAHFELLD